jgi:toxin ParE1/3/4
VSRFIISPRATKDLKELIDYFAEQNVAAGEKLIQEFTKKCPNLTQFPMMGRSYSSVRPNLRRLSMLKYVILYRLLDDGSEIVRVVRGNRDLTSLFDDE